MVNELEDAPRWRAPEPLEDVRRFLNTLDHSPRTNETRDYLAALVRDGGRWRKRLPNVRRPKLRELDALVALRRGLRDAVEDKLDVQWLNSQLGAAPVGVTVVPDANGGHQVRFVAGNDGTAAADLLAVVVEAISAGTWPRLKACPDCRLVFFDRSRNASKRWCQMSAKGGGRACGSIAKVRSWRTRERVRA